MPCLERGDGYMDIHICQNSWSVRMKCMYFIDTEGDLNKTDFKNHSTQTQSRALALIHIIWLCENSKNLPQQRQI